MKLRRRNRIAKSESDREYLIENPTEHDHSKVGRMVWKLAKGTWKAFKTGFQTAVAGQTFCVALEPTAVASSILDYQTRKRQRQ